MQWPLPMDKEKAVNTARQQDVIVGTKATFRPFVDDMKAVNPDLVVLVYMNGTEAQRDEGDLYPEEFYSHDASGSRVRSKEFGNYLMDPSHPGWIQHVADECKSFIALGDYDGCMIDVLGSAPLHPGYSGTTPINRSTGQPWTVAQWLNATGRLATAAKAAVGSKLVYANGLQEGDEYFHPEAPSEGIMGNADGGMVELFLRAPRAGLNQYESEERWKKDVDMLVDAGSGGKGLLVVTKVWIDAPNAAKDSWHKYSLASFLLGAKPGMYFTFLYDRDTLTEHRFEKSDLGPATGSYAKVDNVYQRSFQQGKALVNPTKNTYTVQLGGVYYNLAGNPVTSVTLGPNSGEVLTTGAKSSPSPTPTNTRTPTPTPTNTSPSPSPSESPSPDPQTIEVTRNISLRLRRDLVLKGRVVPVGTDAEIEACTDDVPVRFERRRVGQPWDTLRKQIVTNELAKYRIKVRGRRGKYRASATQVTRKVGNIEYICRRAVSDVDRHRR